MPYLNVDDGMAEHPRRWHELTASALKVILDALDDDPRALRVALAEVGYVPKTHGPKDRLHLNPVRETRKPIPQWLRRKVYRRDGNACVYCGATADLTLDHITAWISGGPDTEDNLQTLCKPCNSKKGAT